jgi:hypothetical protein
MATHLCCLNLCLVNLDLTRYRPQHADEEKVRLLKRHVVGMPGNIYVGRQIQPTARGYIKIQLSG